MTVITGIICLTVAIVTYRLTKCKHTYVYDTSIDYWGNSDGEYPISIAVVDRCSKCGKRKVTTIK